MSDVPWAVAWYGRKQCVGLTLEVERSNREQREDFAELGKSCGKLVNGLLLTPVTLGTGFRDMRRSDSGWPGLVLLYGLKRQVPVTFPLAFEPKNSLFPDVLMLADFDRWDDRPAAGTKSSGATGSQ